MARIFPLGRFRSVDPNGPLPEISQLCIRRECPRLRIANIGLSPAYTARIIVDFVHERRRGHSSGSPALRSASNHGCEKCEKYLSPSIHLTLSLGLRRRASAIAVFASSISPFSACAVAKRR